MADPSVAVAVGAADAARGASFIPAELPAHLMKRLQSVLSTAIRLLMLMLIKPRLRQNAEQRTGIR